jgi:RimJ/RimL family protein N-acetyltransferase
MTLFGHREERSDEAIWGTRLLRCASSRSTGRKRTSLIRSTGTSARQGFATEAATATRDWLFEHFRFSRAASFIRPDNHASKRVAERLGAVCELTFELRGSSYEYWVHHRAGRNS